MFTRISDLRGREVISLTDGSRIGYLEDVEFDLKSGGICALVTANRSHWLSFFAREEDCIIPFSCVKTAGEDAILVDFTPEKRPRSAKRRILANFFENT